ncbi:MAG: ferredoxin III, nif-specific [Rhodospirillaceae bacterium]|nr:ferredoxin III, nif-specific [Rhodospirillaceae bacterium]
MATIMGTTRGGKPWEPQFVISIDPKLCIGCGRCYKTCARNVFELIEREEDDDDDMDDDQAMIMSVKDAMDCIGCEACGKVCSKKAISHAPAAL